jgi:hypothetical protein
MIYYFIINKRRQKKQDQEQTKKLKEQSVSNKIRTNKKENK